MLNNPSAFPRVYKLSERRHPEVLREMLLSVLAFEGLKSPTVALLSLLSSLSDLDRALHELIGGHVRLLVSGYVRTGGTQSVPRNRKMGSKTKKTERSRTTALRTDASPVQARILIRSASASSGAESCESAAKSNAISGLTSLTFDSSNSCSLFQVSRLS